MVPRSRAVLPFVLAIAFAVGCSSGDPSGSPGSRPGAAGDGADDLFGNSSTGTPTMLGEPRPVGDDGSSGKLNQDNACAATSVGAEQVVVEEEVEVQVEVEEAAPVALYLMFDHSISMGTSDLWDPAVAAVTSFVNDPASAGMDVALQYFPNGGSCSTGSGYSTPAVPMGRLPGHAQAIIDSLAGVDPDGFGTPIEGALRGATEYCKAFQQSNPDEECVAVLITDGKPQFASGCEENHDALAAIAGAAYGQEVRTFAVGLYGADFGLLDKIAMQGGAADCDPGPGFACDVSGGASLLLDALTSIRDTVTVIQTRTETQTRTEMRSLDCEWVLPEPSGDQEVDPSRVNVRLATGGEAYALGQVENLGACAAGGWYYDDQGGAPTRIIACPDTCSSIQNAADASVEILLGCATTKLEVE